MRLSTAAWGRVSPWSQGVAQAFQFRMDPAAACSLVQIPGSCLAPGGKRSYEEKSIFNKNNNNNIYNVRIKAI